MAAITVAQRYFGDIVGLIIIDLLHGEQTHAMLFLLAKLAKWHPPFKNPPGRGVLAHTSPGFVQSPASFSTGLPSFGILKNSDGR